MIIGGVQYMHECVYSKTRVNRTKPNFRLYANYREILIYSAKTFCVTESIHFVS